MVSCKEFKEKNWCNDYCSIKQDNNNICPEENTQHNEEIEEIKKFIDEMLEENSFTQHIENTQVVEIPLYYNLHSVFSGCGDNINKIIYEMNCYFGPVFSRQIMALRKTANEALHENDINIKERYFLLIKRKLQKMLSILEENERMINELMKNECED